MKNRIETEKKLVAAVGVLLQREGYRGLTIRGIAREAGVNKELIYRYFDSLSGLVTAYVLQKDYWLGNSPEFASSSGTEFTSSPQLELAITTMIQDQFKYFRASHEMQHIILSQLIDKNELLDEIGHKREELGDKIFETSKEFMDSRRVDLKSVCALLISGVYYMVLHARHNTSTVCGMDINTSQDREKINQTIEQIVGWTFKAGID